MAVISMESGTPSSPPRAVAVSGILFSILFIVAIVLVRLAVPDPRESDGWLEDPGRRDSVRTALNLVPFTGIAFLWFMAVLRNLIGLREDRFFATVFLGSGLLFVGMLFVSAAIAGALLATADPEGGAASQAGTFAFGRRMCATFMNIYAIKMAAVFTFVTSSIGLRTAFLPRWLAYVGFAAGLVMLAAITNFAWIALLFPCWVLLVSAYILVTEFRRTPVKT